MYHAPSKDRARRSADDRRVDGTGTPGRRSSPIGDGLRLPALAVDHAVRAGRGQHRVPSLPRDAPLPSRHARRAYACDHCGTQVYPTAGTFMQGSGLGVATWFAAAWELIDGDANVAPRALADELGVSYKTALRIKRKLEEALAPGSADADLLERLRRDFGGPGRPPPASPRATAPPGQGEHPRRGLPRLRGAWSLSLRGSPTSPARPGSRARSSTTTTSPRTRCCSPPCSGPTSTPAGNCTSSGSRRATRSNCCDAPSTWRSRPRACSATSTCSGSRRGRACVCIRTCSPSAPPCPTAGPASSRSWSRRARRPVCSARWRRPRRSPSAWSRSRTASASARRSATPGMQVQRVRELLVSFVAQQLGVAPEALAEV